MSLFLDSKKALNDFENIWSKSTRSLELDRAKTENPQKIDGFLAVWPEDAVEQNNAESSDVSENEIVAIQQAIESPTTIRTNIEVNSANVYSIFMKTLYMYISLTETSSM